MSVWALALLFLEFIPSGRAAECLKPDVTGTHVLTTETLLKNDFLDGSTVTIECATGHVMESGSNKITCANGTWSAPELICKKKDCGPPSPSPNLTYQILKGTLFGAQVKAICDAGYYLQGSSYRQCLANGWTGRAKCILITCSKPTEILNGMITVQPNKEDPVVGDIIEFTCDPNYRLIGNKTIICEESGDYNSKSPECQLIECQPPQIKFGVQILGESRYTHNSEAKFQCQTGYRMEGSPRIVCEEHGWSKFPVCIKDTVQLTTKSTATSTSTTSLNLLGSEFGQTPNATVTTGTDSVYTAAVIGGIFGIVIVILFISCCVHHYTKRKGSYDTREALKTKEELMQKWPANLTHI